MLQPQVYLPASYLWQVEKVWFVSRICNVSRPFSQLAMLN
jgi:hypothetical protein